MEADEKPLKLGSLWMQNSGFKKSYKCRFSILTTKMQLIWFRKQEDHLEGKRGGVIKKLETCTIEEGAVRILPQTGTEVWWFTIHAGSKHTIGTDISERDRTNWIVEILKFRGIAGLIEIVNDTNHPLRRHAAYGLCNLAGRTSDNSQTRIVTENGVRCLLEYQKTCVDPELIDSINYSLCKLSNEEQNKLPLTHELNHLFFLVASDNLRWKDFGLKTLCNCSTHIDIPAIIYLFPDGLNTLLAVLQQEPVLGEALLILASQCILNCLVYYPAKQYFIEKLENISSVIPAFSPLAQASVVDILTKCMIEERDKTINASNVTTTLIPLIISPLESLQESTTQLLSQLTVIDSHKARLQSQECLENVMDTLASQNENIVLQCLNIIHSCFCCEEHISRIVCLPEKLNIMIEVLKSENKSIVIRTVEILHHISSQATSVSIVAENQFFLLKLFPLLLTLQTTLEQSEYGNASEIVSQCLQNLSKERAVQLLICQKNILFLIYSQLATSSTAIQLSNMILLRNCAYTATGKVYIRSLEEFSLLEGLLDLQDIPTLEVTVELFYLLLCCSTMRKKCVTVIEKKIRPFLSSETSNSNLQRLSCLAIANTACDQSKYLKECIPGLFELLGSPEEEVISTSLFCLSSFTTHHSAILIQDGNLKQIRTLLNYENEGILLLAVQLLADSFRKAPEFIKEKSEKLEFISFFQAILSQESNANLLLHSYRFLSELSRLKMYQADIAKCLSGVVANFVLKSKLPLPLEYALSVLSIMIPLAPQEAKHASELVSRCCSLLSHTCISIQVHSATILRQIALAGLYLLPGGCITDSNELLADCSSFAHADKAAMCYYARHLSVQVREILTEALFTLLKEDNGEILFKDINQVRELLQCFILDESTETKMLEPIFVVAKKNTIQLHSKVPWSTTASLELSSVAKDCIVKSAYLERADFVFSPIQPLNMSLMMPHQTAVKRRKKSKSLTAHKVLIGNRNQSGVRKFRQRSHTSKGKDIVAESYSFYRYQLEAIVGYRIALESSLASERASLLHILDIEVPNAPSVMEILPQREIPNLIGVEKKSSFLTINAPAAIVLYSSSAETFHPQLEAVQLEDPFDCSSSFSYFEVLIICTGKLNLIGIGVAKKESPLHVQPGWYPDSWAYHGDDGNKHWFDEGCKNDFFGTCFSSGDVVGCGINNVTMDLFFTKNGFIIDPIAFKCLPKGLHPTVCLGSEGESVLINQGQLPFLWNFDLENVQKEVPAAKATYKEKSEMKTKRGTRVYEQHAISVFGLHLLPAVNPL